MRTRPLPKKHRDPNAPVYPKAPRLNPVQKAVRDKLSGYTQHGDRVVVTLPTLRFMRELPKDWLK